jgi:hypothetical protein
MPVIPRISMPKDMICDIEHLEQHSEDCGGSAREMREKYAKAAMTLFYPFRDTELFDVDLDGDLWNKFKRLMTDDKFCSFGLQVLQNMQDNLQSRKCKLPDDELKATTSVPKGDSTAENNRYVDEEGDLEFENADSFDEYDFNQLVDHAIEEDGESCFTTKRNLNDLKRLPRGKGQIWSSAIISSRADLDNSLFVESRTEASHTDTIQNTEPSPDSRDTNTTVRSSSYMFLLSIVSGSIIKDMSDGITEPGYKAFDQLTLVSTEPVFEDWNDLGFEAQQDYPTISSVAQSMMEKKGIRLDSIQYVAYEI